MLAKKLNELDLDDSHRVLFVHHGSLLDEGVMNLVGSNTELIVLKGNYTGDELLARDITKNCPDVVIMCQQRTCKLEGLFRFLTSNPALEKLRMIVFHTNDNSVEIFSRKEMRAIPSQDFLAIVQGAHATI